MRKVTLGLANSLDNYIARKDGGFDWIHWSDEVAEISAKFMKTVDALLIGRKTYDGMLAYGQTSYPGAKNYVFSHSKKTRQALAAGVTGENFAEAFPRLALELDQLHLRDGSKVGC